MCGSQTKVRVCQFRHSAISEEAEERFELSVTFVTHWIDAQFPVVSNQGNVQVSSSYGRPYQQWFADR